MKIFDTHAHYDDEQYDEDREETLRLLKQGGVTHVVNCASSEKSLQTTLDLAHHHPFVYAALGIHPSDADDYTPAVEERLRQLLKDPKVLAVGEIGLDYYWDENPPKAQQQQVLLRQLDLARQAKKPVILHVREAYGDMLTILKSQQDVSGVLHSFSGSLQTAQEVLAMGYYLGIGGVATFKNAKKLPEVIRQAPLDRLITETDAPYLTPAPHRGKRNRSDYISWVIRAIAAFREEEEEAVAKALYANALRFFGLPQEL